MKYVAIVLMIALGVGAALIPAQTEPVPGDVPAREVPPVSICPLLEGASGTTDMAILSSINGGGRVSTFKAGAETGSVEFATGITGSVIVPAADAGAVGEAGGLIEMPSDTTVAGVITRGSGTLAAESCADTPSSQMYIAGGTTVGSADFSIQFLNPYAGEAMVDLTVSTEAGLESDERFDAVIIPALSTITLSLKEIIPERETIAVDVQTVRGSVLAVGRRTGDADAALWRAVEPAQDWWLPVPAGARGKQLQVGTTSTVDVEYQIDLYGPDGYVEAFQTGTIRPRGRALVDLAAISEDAIGVRVVSTGPVVPTFWIAASGGLAATTASPVDAPLWLLPGASGPAGGAAELVVLNTGIDDVTVTVRSLREESITRDFTLPAEGILSVDLIAANGYRVEATGPVVALWTSRLEGTITTALGIPIQDG